MFEAAIITLLLITVIDRAGIPLSFITGMFLLRNEPDKLFMFFVFAVAAGILGDVFMYIGGVYFKNQKDTNYFTQNAGIKNKIINKSAFIVKNPVLWIYVSKVFNYINQLIPIALGLNGYSLIKFLINAAISNIVWFGLFFILSESWLKFLTQQGKTIGIVTGVIGLGVLLLGLKFYEAKLKNIK
ncbi:MAG: hypothetical protein V1773_12280 [bacterium]